MRLMIAAAMALGIGGAMAVATPSPSGAQGIYLSNPDLYVEVGRRDRHRYRQRYRRNYDAPYRYVRPYRRGMICYAAGCCPRGFTIQDGVCKPYRGY